MESIIDRVFSDGNELIGYLTSQNQITLLSEASNTFAKNLLLSSASYFESEISNLIIKFTELRSNNDDMLISLVRSKAVTRQYHTYFNWTQTTNANTFFSMFGKDFSAKMKEKVNSDTDLNNGIKAFLTIGSERNNLVHQNYAAYSLSLTAKEIYEQYILAKHFVDYLSREFLSQEVE